MSRSFRVWRTEFAFSAAAAFLMAILAQFAITRMPTDSGNFVYDGVLAKAWQTALLFGVVGLTSLSCDKICAVTQTLTLSKKRG